MNKTFGPQKDRSAVGTIIIVAVIVVIIVAGIGAYVLLSGNSEEKDTRTVAPGTSWIYDVNGKVMSTLDLGGTLETKVVGQSSEQYLVENSYDLYFADEDSNRTPLPADNAYSLIDKDTGADEEMVKTGTEKISTVNGTKTLDVWVQTEGPATTKAYVDRSSGTVYRMSYEDDNMSFDADLRSEVIVLQETYTESPAIGNNLTYSVTGSENGITVTGSLIMDLVAESPEGFWQRSVTTVNGYSEIEFSIAHEDRLEDSVSVGSQVISTIDGEKNTEVWKLNDAGTEYTYYVDPESGTTYRLTATAPGMSLTMDLTSKILDLTVT